MNLVQKDFPEMSFQDGAVDELLTIVRQYAVVTNESGLGFALKKYLKHDIKRKENLPLLDELLTKETYQYSQEKWNGKTPFVLRQLRY